MNTPNKQADLTLREIGLQSIAFEMGKAQALAETQKGVEDIMQKFNYIKLADVMEIIDKEIKRYEHCRDSCEDQELKAIEELKAKLQEQSK